MRVLFVTQYGPSMASSRTRVFQYFPCLHRHGFETRVVTVVPDGGAGGSGLLATQRTLAQDLLLHPHLVAHPAVRVASLAVEPRLRPAVRPESHLSLACAGPAAAAAAPGAVRLRRRHLHQRDPRPPLDRGMEGAPQPPRPAGHAEAGGRGCRRERLHRQLRRPLLPGHQDHRPGGYRRHPPPCRREARRGDRGRRVDRKRLIGTVPRPSAGPPWRGWGSAAPGSGFVSSGRPPGPVPGCRWRRRSGGWRRRAATWPGSTSGSCR